MTLLKDVGIFDEVSLGEPKAKSLSTSLSTIIEKYDMSAEELIRKREINNGIMIGNTVEGYGKQINKTRFAFDFGKLNANKFRLTLQEGVSFEHMVISHTGTTKSRESKWGVGVSGSFSNPTFRLSVKASLDKAKSSSEDRHGITLEARALNVGTVVGIDAKQNFDPVALYTSLDEDCKKMVDEILDPARKEETPTQALKRRQKAYRKFIDYYGTGVVTKLHLASGSFVAGTVDIDDSSAANTMNASAEAGGGGGVFNKFDISAKAQLNEASMEAVSNKSLRVDQISIPATADSTWTKSVASSFFGGTLKKVLENATVSPVPPLASVLPEPKLPTKADWEEVQTHDEVKKKWEKTKKEQKNAAANNPGNNNNAGNINQEAHPEEVAEQEDLARRTTLPRWENNRATAANNLLQPADEDQVLLDLEEADQSLFTESQSNILLWGEEASEKSKAPINFEEIVKGILAGRSVVGHEITPWTDLLPMINPINWISADNVDLAERMEQYFVLCQFVDYLDFLFEMHDVARFGSSDTSYVFDHPNTPRRKQSIMIAYNKALQVVGDMISADDKEKLGVRFWEVAEKEIHSVYVKKFLKIVYEMFLSHYNIFADAPFGYVVKLPHHYDMRRRSGTDFSEQTKRIDAVWIDGLPNWNEILLESKKDCDKIECCQFGLRFYPIIKVSEPSSPKEDELNGASIIFLNVTPYLHKDYDGDRVKKQYWRSKFKGLYPNYPEKFQMMDGVDTSIIWDFVEKTIGTDTNGEPIKKKVVKTTLKWGSDGPYEIAGFQPIDRKDLTLAINFAGKDGVPFTMKMVGEYPFDRLSQLTEI